MYSQYMYLGESLVLGWRILQKSESITSLSIFPFLLPIKAKVRQNFSKKIIPEGAELPFYVYVVLYVAAKGEHQQNSTKSHDFCNLMIAIILNPKFIIKP